MTRVERIYSIQNKLDDLRQDFLELSKLPSESARMAARAYGDVLPSLVVHTSVAIEDMLKLDGEGKGEFLFPLSSLDGAVT